MDIITAFDAPVTRALQQEVVAALQQIAKAHGLTVSAAGGTIASDSVTLKVRFEAEGTSQGAEDFKRYAATYGLEVGDLGRTFTVNRQRYTIVGLNIKKRARPVQVRREDNGKVYMADVKSVRSALTVS